jgi:hypothetical protein
MSDSKTAPEEQEILQKKGPRNPNEINPKMASDIHYWAEEFQVTGQQLHEAIRTHCTHLKKLREAFNHKQH